MKTFCRAHPMLLLLISAVLSALPMTFSFLFFLSYVSFIPFFFVFLSQEKTGFWKSFFRAFFFGFCYHAAVYFWFLWLYPFDSVGFSKPVAAFVAALGWLGASLIHGFLFSLIGAVSFLFKRLSLPRYLHGFGVILAFLGIEKLMEFSALAFPWVRVSLGQYRAPVFIQSASLWGVLGVDLLILTVNLLLTLFLLSEKKKKILYGSAAAALFFSNLIAGIVIVSLPEKKENTLRVSLVQGSILSGEKWTDGGFDLALETHFALTREAAKENPDLIVWAETALPVRLDSSYQSALREKMELLSGEVGCPILVGAFSAENGQLQNSAYLISENTISKPYSKRQLVPFGEYMPYRDFLTGIFPMLEKISQIEDDLAPGTSTALFDLNGEKIGALICYESIFPRLNRESVSDGAGMLGIITNDSWYEDSPAAAQHLAHAVFRCAENRRDLFRCANSGISALIRSDGVITGELGVLEKGVLTGTVSFSEGKTPYTVLGDSFLLFALAVWLGFGIASFLKERRKDGQ